MKNLDLLFIAPYPELAALAEQVARDFRDINLVVHTGDLDEGVRQALADYHTRFDAVISRGGTADTLEEELSIPIIKMGLTVREVLNSLVRANPGQQDMAVVGFSSLFQELRALQPLLPYSVDFFCADFDDEIPDLLDSVSRAQYPAILCDTVSFRQAEQRSMRNCHLLLSDETSVREAIEQAMSVCHVIERERRANLLLWHVIRDLNADFAAFDDNGQLVYTSISGGSEGNGIFEYVAARRATAEHGDRFVVRRAGFTFDIRARSLVVAGEPYKVFSIKRSKRVTDHAGIDFLDAEEVRVQYDRSAFATTGAATVLAPTVRRGVESSSPLLLEGEVGSGKDQVARLIYLEGGGASQPFVQISCDLLNERAWRHLLKSHESPLFRSGITIYVRGLNALEPERWRNLLAVIRDSSLPSRNRLIVSCSDTDGRACDAALKFAEQLRCTVLVTPPLREAADVPDRLQRYLDRLAREERVPSPSIEPEARELARQATWPRNYLQLREVAERLFAVHGSMPITGKLMCDALIRQEQRDSRAHAGTALPRGDGGIAPLAETNRREARAAVEYFDGNKTKAARALGIGRTTLWRLLSERS